MAQPLTQNRILLARSIALVADALQLGLIPLFAGGALEGADLALDVIVGILLTWICGFHLAFLPTIIAEALPGVDLVPTWTVATLFVTRGGARAPELPTAPQEPKRK
jgi:hypothetical protein